MVALQIDSPKGESFEYRTLRTPGFTGTAGDGLLHVVGFTGVDAHADGEHRVELLVINNRPALDPVTGTPLMDQSAVGADSTIEVFEVRGSKAEEMIHVRSLADELIATPNRVAVIGGTKGFYATNDHGPYKVGLVSRTPVVETRSLDNIRTDVGPASSNFLRNIG